MVTAGSRKKGPKRRRRQGLYFRDDITKTGSWIEGVRGDPAHTFPELSRDYRKTTSRRHGREDPKITRRSLGVAILTTATRIIRNRDNTSAETGGRVEVRSEVGVITFEVTTIIASTTLAIFTSTNINVDVVGITELTDEESLQRLARGQADRDRDSTSELRMDARRSEVSRAESRTKRKIAVSC